MNFSGIYKGTLWYGKGYPDAYEGAALSFEMKIEEVENDFSGIAHDTDGVGMSPDEAEVVGIITEKMVSFNKVYKRFHYSDEEGNVVVDDKHEGFPILYEGVFNSETGFYEGTWKYEGFRRYWIFFFKRVELGSGTFRLKGAGGFESLSRPFIS